MFKCSSCKTIFLVCAFCAVTPVSPRAQIFTSLFSFDGTDGANPNIGPLVQGTNGNFFGTTQIGGNIGCGTGVGCGTVFEMTPGGKLTTLYSFCNQTNCTDGSQPRAGLLQGINGNFYGTTVERGAGACAGHLDCGTVFEIVPAGKLTTLYNFCSETGCTDGDGPFAGLVQAANGGFYGTTSYGGSSNACKFGGYTVGCGTVFSITPSGNLTTLYNFCANGYPHCTDGYWPAAALLQATDGNFYGTTEFGGANGWGTVFEITPTGTFKTLYTFCSKAGCTDGGTPTGWLIQATDGDFYGTTVAQGAKLGGTVFKITPEGTLTTLYSFCLQGYNCTDDTIGEGPQAGLVQGTNGRLYGTTVQGGGSHNCTYGCGTIFELTQQGEAWTLKTLHSFDLEDGWYPYGLFQATNGNLYGTTYYGGAGSDGTVFTLDVGLGPFVRTLPTFGPVGTPVMILGNNLTGATGVSFNGTAATFTVVSDTEIETIVPAGATTGKVQVTTFSGTLVSNVAFRVTTPCVTGPDCMLPMRQ